MLFQVNKSREFKADILKLIDSIWKELKRLQNQRNYDIIKFETPSVDENKDIILVNKPSFFGSEIIKHQE